MKGLWLRFTFDFHYLPSPASTSSVIPPLQFSKLSTMAHTQKMGLFWFIPVLNLLFTPSSAEIATKPGLNYGQLGNNLPTPRKSVELIKSLKVGRVKIYDANPKIFRALANTNIQVSIMVSNELITAMAPNQSLTDEWVRSNVVPFYPNTMIRYLLVGNEILSQPDARKRERRSRERESVCVCERERENGWG